MGIVLHPLFRLFDADLLEKLDGFLISLFLRSLIVPDHAFHYLLADSHGGVKACHGVLEDHGNLPAVDILPDPLLVLFQDVDGLLFSFLVRVGEVDFAGIYDGVLIENAHGGLHRDGLAGARLADDGCGRAPLELDIHSPDGVDHSGGRLKGNIEVFYRNNIILFFFHLSPP